MKVTSLVFGSTVGIVFFMLFPIIFIMLNTLFGLPVYNNLTLNIIGTVFYLVGAGIFIYTTSLFKSKGKGTPVPIQPPQELVIDGAFKYSRNPMYVAYWFIQAGTALVFGHDLLFVYFLTFMLANHLYVVLYEEKELSKRFSKRYAEYQRNVSRYMPRLHV